MYKIPKYLKGAFKGVQGGINKGAKGGSYKKVTINDALNK